MVRLDVVMVGHYSVGTVKKELKLGDNRRGFIINTLQTLLRILVPLYSLIKTKIAYAFVFIITNTLQLLLTH